MPNQRPLVSNISPAFRQLLFVFRQLFGFSIDFGTAKRRLLFVPSLLHFWYVCTLGNGYDVSVSIYRLYLYMNQLIRGCTCILKHKCIKKFWQEKETCFQKTVPTTIYLILLKTICKHARCVCINCIDAT